MKVTHTNLVLSALKRGPITALQALRDFGCMRLGARIWDLRQRGHRIACKLVTVPTRAGRARVAQYRLIRN